jgi:uncharacterized protein (DUF2147 family)
MRKLLHIALFSLVLSIMPLSAEDASDVLGFWKTMDSKETFTTSIMIVYQHNGKLYGRVIVSFNEKDGRLLETWKNPIEKIEKLSSKPYLLATDIFWGHTVEGKMWSGGRVLDPRTGYNYKSDIWVENNKLVVKGKLGPFGVRQLFYKAYSYDMPSGIPFPKASEFIPSPP